MNTNDLNIMFKVTTRQRPKQFDQVIQNIINNCELKNYFILVTADLDDPTMYNNMVHEYCQARGILLVYGPSKNKVDAINRDIYAFKEPHWDILVNVSDDMEFMYKGFDIDIRKQFEDGLDWFLHFPDNNRSDICTLSILGRTYFERFNYIYYPHYESVCCDVDATEQAKYLDRYKYNPLVIVKHNHPAYQSAEWDELYKRNESPDLYERDQKTLKIRRQNNYADFFDVNQDVKMGTQQKLN